ncbi:MAG: inorganic phosphate transporter [Bacteroidales bacterium]|nr:inorganic phosphate transporter [Bacteroidales bacterium]MBN2819470.1 inorganic phosphate transporter [Bacteroidales bacterium]
METIFIIVVGVLILLAVSDLVVGVSNDAVNFLNSAIGSKVASLKVILLIAAAGILIGATFSSGMMEVARKGIFYPGQFYFTEIMIVFLAVMLTDVILLDLFNTYGLPTSTTVSIVFELLGAAVGIAVIKIVKSTGDLSEMATYINSAKALAIISGILISVVISFSVGALVQYLSRLIFSFNYTKTLKYFGAIWGGIAISAITYFILIKGAKGSSLITDESLEWIKEHTGMILLMSFAGWTIVLQLLYWIFKLNILRLIVLVGTFALAMAFAGNDLVNFIGVPLAGIESFKDFVANGVDPDNFAMTSLAGKVKTPTIFLLIAGLIMVITLWLSKKAKSVVKTTLNLSDQDAVNERFESSAFARTLVRGSVNLNKSLSFIVPGTIKKGISKRFDSSYFTKKVKKETGVSFDLVRASVNLVVASILIALGTSLKLPLSTTYVTFMVAMGTSLADGAWDRESAVYRISGVITVIGGWFFTAISAFTLSLLIALLIYFTWYWGLFIMVFIALFVVYRTHALHQKRSKKDEEDTEFSSGSESSDIYETCSGTVSNLLIAASKSYSETSSGLTHEKRKTLKNALKKAGELNDAAKKLKKRIPKVFKELSDDAFEMGHHYAELIDYLREAMHNIGFIVSPAYKHIDNNHKPLTESQALALKELTAEIQDYINLIVSQISKADYKEEKKTIETSITICDLIVKARKKQLKLIKKEPGSTRTNALFLDLLNETKNLVLNLVNMYKSFRDFSEQYKRNGYKSLME